MSCCIPLHQLQNRFSKHWNITVNSSVRIILSSLIRWFTLHSSLRHIHTHTHTNYPQYATLDNFTQLSSKPGYQMEYTDKWNASRILFAKFYHQCHTQVNKWENNLKLVDERASEKKNWNRDKVRAGNWILNCICTVQCASHPIHPIMLVNCYNIRYYLQCDSNVLHIRQIHSYKIDHFSLCRFSPFVHCALICVLFVSFFFRSSFLFNLFSRSSSLPRLSISIFRSASLTLSLSISSHNGMIVHALPTEHPIAHISCLYIHVYYIW